ncbi:uncharacterized protein LOC142356219 [Convolutriloba macropyga]|uniref:uncharacterized protein LOC142356219 n=1 Tax=Convolutriloba macropyga TaxID=536237 RepID=UPI003F51CF55
MGDEKESLRGKPKSWSADLFGCFSNPLWCFITTFLPCVTSIRIGLRLGMITSVVIFVIALFVFSSCETMTSGFASTYNRYQRRKKLNIGDEEDNEYKLGIAITGLTVSMVGLLLATIVIAVIQFRYRRAVRLKYNLTGSDTTDVLFTCLCVECSLCQLNNQQDYEDAAEVMRR